MKSPAQQLKEEYGLRDVVMAGDRGMITTARLRDLYADMPAALSRAPPTGG